MSKPSPRTIAREIKQLQRIVEDSSDPLEARIAYIMSTTLRWATEETHGWRKPSEDIKTDTWLAHNDAAESNSHHV